MHLFADPEHRLLGVNTQESFEAVFELARRQHPEPDMICLTGDMSQDESLIAYERLAELISQYHCPKYWIPGNHDDIAYIEKVYSRFHIQNQKHIVLDHWQVVLLDTKKEDAVEGQMNDDQFVLLEKSLSTFPEHHALIFMHHHPIPVGSKWLDNLMLNNAKRFWDAIEVYKNIRTIVCGHVHQEKEFNRNGINIHTTPSTCFQFKRDSTQFALEALKPGYRVIELFQDGSFKTEVFRADDYVLNLDEKMGGY
uniref:3'5'-cyclic-nucleotide phosphodiesterase n=1 Tax=uncultured microorganism TaxID=358574 RepID=F8UGY6_9ZZZZ|nr:3'5'-cyclic-nucleotide phosphodiesterase [uncultured microorganism]